MLTIFFWPVSVFSFRSEAVLDTRQFGFGGCSGGVWWWFVVAAASLGYLNVPAIRITLLFCFILPGYLLLERAPSAQSFIRIVRVIASPFYGISKAQYSTAPS
jgi:hypothetical protein